MSEPRPPETETEQFAAALARILEPVRRIPPLRLVAAALSLAALFVAGIATAVLGPRDNVLASLPLVGGLAGFFMFGVGGLVAALGASVPGREDLSRVGFGGIAIALAIWAVSSIAALRGGGMVGPSDANWISATFTCLGLATAVGFVPAVALLAFVIGAFPYRPALAGGLGAAAMVAFGAGAVHLTCAHEGVFHVSLGHVIGPLVGGALVGGALVVFRRRATIPPS